MTGNKAASRLMPPRTDRTEAASPADMARSVRIAERCVMAPLMAIELRKSVPTRNQKARERRPMRTETPERVSV
jgi:hypothetical protein